MSKKSDEFEKKITRIKQVLETSNAQITWNDKMPDPDNEEQPRQIDISIKNENKVTHIECRIHRKPQDVKWIEELIGRKVSLEVDSMVGVSASGFTKGAIKKAKAKGIILRTLSEITIEEAESWGEKTEIEVLWLAFNHLKMNFFFPENIAKNITKSKILDWIISNQEVVYQMIEKIANDYPKPKSQDDVVKGSIQISFNVSDDFNSIGFEKIEIETELEYFRTPEEVVQFHTYGCPSIIDLKKRTSIEENDTKSIELINSNEMIGITLDLSKIMRPINHIFKGVGWRVNRPSKGISANLVSTFERSFEIKNMEVEIRVSN